MLINISNLGKSFGKDTLFRGLSFNVDPGNKIAIVGKNGCGKSTLLKVIMGIIDSDEGSIEILEDAKIGYLEQSRYSNESEDKLSGGEATKSELIKIFDNNPSIMLLDEPTNHLDLATIEWLENKLLSFKGALLVVSHDRYFLDKCANKVLDMDDESPCLYKGNYSDYVSQKEIKLLSLQRQYENQRREIARQEAVIKKLRQFNRQKSIKRADSRQKMLERIVRIDAPKEETSQMSLSLEPLIEPGKDVLFVDRMSKSFGDNELFKDVSFDIRRGEHVALIGANGTGKTTLLKILNGSESSDAGSFRTGTNVSIGYYDQAQQVFDESKSLYDEVHDDFAYLTETKVRSTLAAFGFYEDDISKKVSMLSGGERGRLSLAKLMLSEANLLLLDEPTNHLDMASKEILEDAINLYSGTLLFVSHDRYFVNSVADRVLDLADNEIRNYLGGYDDFVEKRNELIEKGIIKKQEVYKDEFKTQEPSQAKLSWEEAKRKKASDRKRENDIKNTNDRIDSVEKRIEEIDEAFMDPSIATNSFKLGELSKEKEALEDELLVLYETLESLEG